MADTSTVHLVLVGHMGSGKSSVGRRLADEMGRPFVDTDHLIEQQERRSIRDIFAADGEDVFRGIESSVLSEALASPVPSVIATGGGIVGREENRHLLEHHHVVWLRASIDTLATRVASGASRRPLLDGDLRHRLGELDDRRRGLYGAVASVSVDVDGLDLDAVVVAVLASTEDR